MACENVLHLLFNLSFLLKIKIYLLCNSNRVYCENIVVCSAANALTAVGSLIVDAFGVFIFITTENSIDDRHFYIITCNTTRNTGLFTQCS